MPAREHPRYASEYTADQLDRSKRTLLQVAVALGDFLDDVVLVGGLVPLLLVDQAEAAARDEAHVGSVDVDLGIRLAVVSEERYDELAERLRACGFEPDTNERGNPTKQRWVYGGSEDSVVIDFLIDETETDSGQWGRTMHLTEDLAALRALGLSLAFEDAVTRTVEGVTLDGDHAAREVRVCGPAAFAVLKALAFTNRGKEKDAYDLAYVVRNAEGGPEDVAARFAAFGDHAAARRAIDVLQADFSSERSAGPRRASRFLFGEVRDDYVADLVGDLTLFLRAVGSA